MGIVYITGISGSGKSAVLRELDRRGFEAHGVDEEGYADWVDRETGESIPFPHDDPDLDIHEWFRKYRWVFSEQRISALRVGADEGDRIVFLVGTAEDEDRVWYLFDKVIALLVDEATVRSRIQSREDNQFGKDPAEMAAILSWLEGYQELYRGFGATVIDATRPLAQVVDDVVANASIRPK